MPWVPFAWQRRLERQKWDYSARGKRGPGRPRTAGGVEALVCRLARENSWGYTRIQGELLKLDIKLSKGCVADILRRNSLPPSPERKGLTWREFLSRHADTMLCTDFFSEAPPAERAASGSPPEGGLALLAPIRFVRRYGTFGLQANEGNRKIAASHRYGDAPRDDDQLINRVIASGARQSS